MEERTRNPRGEGERLRGALLDVATELLAEVGDVERLSVRAVTRRAGVSPTALYLHFADKDALVGAIKERCFGALRERLEAARDAHPDDPATGLRAMGSAYLAFAREQPGWYGVCFQVEYHRELVDEAWEAHPIAQVGMAVFGVLVAQVARAGGLADAEAFDRATVLWAALHGRASVLLAMPGFPMAGEDRWIGLLAEGWVADPAGGPDRPDAASSERRSPDVSSDRPSSGYDPSSADDPSSAGASRTTD